MYWKKRRTVELYKKLLGKDHKDINQEIITLQEQVNIRRAELFRLKTGGAEATVLAERASVLGELENQLRLLLRSKKL